MIFAPSRYQRRIFRFMEHGSGHGIVRAVAGGGKTSTLVEVARRYGRPGLIVAFNKPIQVELERRLRGSTMLTRTMHALGYGALLRRLAFSSKSRLYLDESKYGRLAEEMVADLGVPESQRLRAARNLRRLAMLARLTLEDTQNQGALQALCARHGIAVGEACLPALPEVLSRGMRLARRRHVVDYVDMVYLPLAMKLELDRYDLVLVDEAQDLSRAQLLLAEASCAAHGRLLFAGDPAQSIYGWAGADHESFERIRVYTGATELALSICYRCPRRVVDLARRMVPYIEPRPGAPEGVVRDTRRCRLAGQLGPGDLVLSRTMYPLVRLCIALMGQKIPARVKGRSVGARITSLLARVAARDGFTYSALEEHLIELMEEELAELRHVGAGEHFVSDVEDLYRCLIECALSFTECHSVGELEQRIAHLFAGRAEAVILSTVHRAKGLEADRVFILGPEQLGHAPEGSEAWRVQEERNVKYVALTRAKRELVFVHA